MFDPIKRIWTWDREGLQRRSAGTGLVGTTATTTAMTIGHPGIVTTLDCDLSVTGATILTGAETLSGLLTITSSAGAGAAGALGPEEVRVQNTQAATNAARIRASGYLDFEGQTWATATGATTTQRFGGFGAVIDTIDATGAITAARHVFTNSAQAIQWSVGLTGNTSQSGTVTVAGTATLSGTGVWGAGEMNIGAAGVGSVTIGTAAGTLFTAMSTGEVILTSLGTASALTLSSARTGGDALVATTGTGAAGVAGGDVAWTLGAGGAGTAGGLQGGAGGRYAIFTGDGGAGHATGAGDAGDAGGLWYDLGDGGAALAGGGAAGLGGSFSLHAGGGGAGSATVAGGLGGSFTLSTGAGGVTGGFGAGVAGQILLQVEDIDRLVISGTGAHTHTATTWDLNATGAVTLDSSGGTIAVGGDAVNQNAGFGTAGVRTVTLGSVTGASATTLRGGTGGTTVSTTGAGVLTLTATATAGNALVSTTGSGAATVAGGNYSWTTGDGGAADATVVDAAWGGDWSLTLGSGGAGNAVGTGDAGDGGVYEVTTGNGGAAAAGGGAAGVGGDWAVACGTGGAGTGAVVGGDGGAVEFSSGAGGATGGAGAGADGAFTIRTGTTNRIAITGAGAHTVTATAWDVNASGAVTLDSSGGGITIGGDAVAQAIGIGTGAAQRAITIGNTTGTSGTTINAGSGGLGVNLPAGNATVTLGAARQVYVDAATTPHTAPLGAFNVVTTTATASVRGIRSLLTVTANVGQTAAIGGEIISDGAGLGAGTMASAFAADVTGHANDLAGSALAAFTATNATVAGAGAYMGLCVGTEYTFALFASSGSISFANYDATIQGLRSGGGGNGPNLTVAGGAAVGPPGSVGGILTLQGGAGTGGGAADGYVRIGQAATAPSWAATATDNDAFVVERLEVGGALSLMAAIYGKQGTDVPSANDATLTATGNYFDVTGAVQINRIAAGAWTAGSVVILQFDSNPVVKHNQALGGGFQPILLAGAVDFASAAGSILTLVYDGANWRETARNSV